AARRGGRPVVPTGRLPGAGGVGADRSGAGDARAAARAGESRRARGRPGHGDHGVPVRDGGGAGGGGRPRAVRRRGASGAHSPRSRRYTSRSASLKHTNRTSSIEVAVPSAARTVVTAVSAARSTG